MGVVGPVSNSDRLVRPGITYDHPLSEDLFLSALKMPVLEAGEVVPLFCLASGYDQEFSLQSRRTNVAMLLPVEGELGIADSSSLRLLSLQEAIPLGRALEHMASLFQSLSSSGYDGDLRLRPAIDLVFQMTDGEKNRLHSDEDLDDFCRFQKEAVISLSKDSGLEINSDHVNTQMAPEALAEASCNKAGKLATGQSELFVVFGEDQIHNATVDVYFRPGKQGTKNSILEMLPVKEEYMSLDKSVPRKVTSLPIQPLQRLSRLINGVSPNNPALVSAVSQFVERVLVRVGDVGRNPEKYDFHAQFDLNRPRLVLVSRGPFVNIFENLDIKEAIAGTLSNTFGIDPKQVVVCPFFGRARYLASQYFSKPVEPKAKSAI